MSGKKITNTLYTNDNLFILHGMNSESVDLIYLDPPFNSKRVYSAPIGSKAAGTSFKDMWTWQDINESYLEKLVDNYPLLVEFISSISKNHSKAMMAYITYMTQRIIELHRILKQAGSFYLHCDPTASHYLKIILDSIFGKNNFRNEIVWCYTGPSKVKTSFQKKHDIILFYVKNKNSVFYADDIRVAYKMIGIGKGDSIFKEGDNKEKVHQLLKKGKVPTDWWADTYLTNISAWKKERVGYPTQKPLALLNRIIKASSKEGDIVMDPFCGCATTCVAAQQLNRKWIGIDIETNATKILIDRLSNDAGLFKDFVHRTDIPKRTDIQKQKPDKKIKNILYENQKGRCGGCKESFKIQNLEIDHIIPKAKGGGDYFENYQLLCGHCNKVKGDRPMEYLNFKLQKIKALAENTLTFGT